MRQAAEEVKRSPVEGFLADDCTGQLQYEAHSLVAFIAGLVLRILDPGWAGADAGLIDGLELKARPASAQEVGK